MNDIVLQSQNLGKCYHQGKHEIRVLEDINFSLHAGEAAAIVGASGSGKTTLLNLLAGLDLATQGDVMLLGQGWSTLNDRQRSQKRNASLGFVYQLHHLLAEFSALENVMIPQLIAGVATKAAKSNSINLLEQVGLAQRLHHKPAQLSGGERQRVAIARALINNPACVLMDEPTGNLDENTAHDVLLLIQALKSQLGMAFLIVTHDESMLTWLDSAYRLTLGKLQSLK